MSVVFADTSFYIALLNRRDDHRESALRFMRTFTGETVTTEFVLLEVANFLSRSVHRSRLRPFIEDLRDQRGSHILPSSAALFDRGLAMYARSTDKQWSLTDCISFVVMDEHGLSDALTADHHFEQAGFRALLR